LTITFGAHGSSEKSLASAVRLITAEKRALRRDLFRLRGSASITSRVDRFVPAS